MAQTRDARQSLRPEPLLIARRFGAPRELVFQAWSTAESMKRWFSPEHYTVPDAEIDFRPGGVCAICMRSPEGQDFWSRGEYVEIAPPERLVFTSGVSVGDAVKFTARTTVTFAVDGAGTHMTVRQEYEVFDEAFLAAVAGAAEGWRTTLDKLHRELARMPAPAGRSAVHGAFTIERRYRAAPSRVFHALTDKDAKSRWFNGDGSYVVLAREMDVRPGGRERLQGRWASGLVTTFDATYFDVVADARLIYAYELHLDARKISVSLATVQLHPDGEGTRLVVTEQGAFLDGYDDAGARERGTGTLLDRLGASLGG